MYSFYNHGNIRMAVTDDEGLESWKAFFNTGTNLKDLATEISYSDYQKMTDKQHLSKAKSMPIKYLKASGKGFFVERRVCAGDQGGADGGCRAGSFQAADEGYLGISDDGILSEEIYR